MSHRLTVTLVLPLGPSCMTAIVTYLGDMSRMPKSEPKDGSKWVREKIQNLYPLTAWLYIIHTVLEAESLSSKATHTCLDRHFDGHNTCRAVNFDKD